MLGDYRRFITNFSELAHPFQVLLKKDAPFIWKQEQEQAFEIYKKILMKTPILRISDFTQQFIIKMDTSNVGISAVLAHMYQDNCEYVICYRSRNLNPAETKYSTIMLSA